MPEFSSSLLTTRVLENPQFRTLQRGFKVLSVGSVCKVPGMRLCDYPQGFGRAVGGGWKYVRQVEKYLDNVCRGQFP